MKIKLLTDSTKAPERKTRFSAGFDIYMPEAGWVDGVEKEIKLGFATKIPKSYAALLSPRSGVGSKFGLELNNTYGLIDQDYRGEWIAYLRTKNGLVYEWKAGDRVLQFAVVSIYTGDSEIVTDLDNTARGVGGFGSTGK